MGEKPLLKKLEYFSNSTRQVLFGMVRVCSSLSPLACKIIACSQLNPLRLWLLQTKKKCDLRLDNSVLLAISSWDSHHLQSRGERENQKMVYASISSLQSSSLPSTQLFSFLFSSFLLINTYYSSRFIRLKRKLKNDLQY